MMRNVGHRHMPDHILGLVLFEWRTVMKLVLILAVTATMGFVAAPAQAGDGQLTRNDGFSLKIKCRNSGCTVEGKAKGGSWGVVEKGPGGSKNFKKLMAKYEAQGFVAQ